MTEKTSLETTYHRHVHNLYGAPLGTSVLTSAANALLTMGRDPNVIREHPELAYRALTNVAYLSTPETAPFNSAVNGLRELGNNKGMPSEWAARAEKDAAEYVSLAFTHRRGQMVIPHLTCRQSPRLQLVKNGSTPT